jgi:hypothetical protein
MLAVESALGGEGEATAVANLVKALAVAFASLPTDQMKDFVDGIKDTKDDMDDLEYNEYITKFQVVDPKGRIRDMYSKTSENIYLSMDLSAKIAS